MSATSAPFGLKPIWHPSGIIRPSRYTIASGYSTGILSNQLVTIAADGTITATAIAGRSIGTFMGCEYTDTNGVRQFSPQWIASTTATEIYAYVTVDPSIIYVIQSNGTLAVSDIGSQANTGTVSAGSTTTGLSSLVLDTVGTLTNSGNATLQIVGLAYGPDNSWGDTYVNVNVRISQHQFVADRAAF
jgi:hypothetical protein